MGIISDRRRKRRMRRLFRSAALVCIALLLGVAAFPLGIRQWIEDIFIENTQVFSAGKGAQAEITLPEMQIYALQLGVFDSEEGASAEARRLERMGVFCMIWRKEKLRLISDAAFRRKDIDHDTARGQEAYIIEDALEALKLRIAADAGEIDGITALIQLPDASLARLIGGEDLRQEIARVRKVAIPAASAYPDHALYTTLAENLIAWCDMMERPELAEANGYGAAAMFALCRELRQALMAASTASAQRTPSTAADVIPPA